MILQYLKRRWKCAGESAKLRRRRSDRSISHSPLQHRIFALRRRIFSLSLHHLRNRALLPSQHRPKAEGAHGPNGTTCFFTFGTIGSMDTWIYTWMDWYMDQILSNIVSKCRLFRSIHPSIQLSPNLTSLHNLSVHPYNDCMLKVICLKV